MIRYLFEAKAHKTPLEWLTELYSRPTADVARSFGLETVGEALKLQRDAAIACPPYVHQKQPMAVEAVGKTAGSWCCRARAGRRKSRPRIWVSTWS